MDPRINIEINDLRQREARAQHVWPDDGLPARHSERPRTTLHPFTVLAEILTRR